MNQYTEQSAAIAAPPQRRRRPALSCIQCRRRKIRCDQQRPSCSQCQRSKDTICSYKPAGSSSVLQSGPQIHEASKNTSPPKSFSVLEDIFQMQPDPSRPVQKDIHGLGQKLPSAFSLADRSAKSAGNGVVKDPQLFNNKLHGENLWPYLVYSPDIERHIVPSSSIYTGNTLERSSAFKMKLIGESHWMNMVSQFDKTLSYILESDRGRSQDTPSEPRLLLHQCKKLGRAIKFQCPPAFLTTDIKITLPSKDVCDELIANYLRTFESVYRIIHIPSFLSRYEEYWSNPDSEAYLRSPFMMQVLLVLALGSALQPDYYITSSLQSTARQWVHTVQQWLSAPIEKSRMNMTGIQIQCLLLLVRETLGVGADLLWISAGTLLRSAIQLGYNRDPRHFPGISILHGEMRRRLWATILELGLKESCGTAMPPLISLNDFDTSPPANVNDTEIHQGMKIAPVSHDLATYTQTTIQILMLQSFPIRLELTSIMTNFQTKLSYDEVLRLHSEMTNACRKVRCLKIVNDNQTLTTLQYNYLDFVLRRPLIALHRPWAAKARTDPRFYFSRKVCLDMCLAIMSYTPSLDYTRLLTIGNGVWLEICSLPPMAICLELIMQLEEAELNPPSAPQAARAKASREPLIQALHEASSFKVARLKAGEKNVKGYLFSCMLLGQIEATENGEDVGKGIGDAALNSLQISLAILKERAAALCGTTACETTPPSESQDWGAMGGLFGNDSMLDVDFDFDMLSSAAVGDWDDQSWL